MDYNFTFSTRDEYLAYRANWRKQYREISDRIRANKREQAANKGGDNSLLQMNLHALRGTARNLMKERTAATEFKNAQLAQLAQAA